jgi:ABC-2 type transport system ATP-binding protein
MSTDTNLVVEISQLTHWYKTQLALSSATFSVARGSIHGFVGPNGAGKTTTLKILATLLKPQRGRVRVFDFDIVADYKRVRQKIGFMPDHFSMYRQMTVYEYLDFFAAAYGLDLGHRNKTIGDVLALTDMDIRRDDLIKSLSRGMQQRVSLARVLVHDPELLLLDEPASGLDPRARVELMEILRELQGMGKTIFISSHILSELALLCDCVTILDRGQVRYSGPMGELTQRDGNLAEYILELADETPAVEESLRALAGVADIAQVGNKPHYRLSFHRDQTDTNTVLRTVLDRGGEVISLQEDLRHLNQAFMDLTEPGVPPPLPK